MQHSVNRQTREWLTIAAVSTQPAGDILVRVGVSRSGSGSDWVTVPTRQKRSSGGQRRSSDATPSGTHTSSAFRRLPVSMAPRAAPSARAVASRPDGAAAAADAATTAGVAATDSGCSAGLAAAATASKFENVARARAGTDGSDWADASGHYCPRNCLSRRLRAGFGPCT